MAQEFDSRLTDLPQSYLARMGFSNWQAFVEAAKQHKHSRDDAMMFLEREGYDGQGHLIDLALPEYRQRLDPAGGWIDRIRADWGTPDIGDVNLTSKLALEGLIEYENGRTRTEVSVGLCLALEDALLNLFSSRGFFTQRLTGDQRPEAFGVLFCGGEAAWRYHDYSAAKHLHGVDFVDGVTRRLPLDPLRLSQCNLMMTLSLRWIMLHEYAHWVLGHLEWSVAMGLSAKAELAESILFIDAGSPERSELSYCMEFQADAFATQLLFSDALANGILADPAFAAYERDRDAFSQFRNGYAPAMVDRGQRFRLLLLASAIPSLLFDVRRQSVCVADTHPPPSARILNIFFTAMSVIGDVLKYEMGDAELEANSYRTDDLRPHFNHVLTVMKEFEIAAGLLGLKATLYGQGHRTDRAMDPEIKASPLADDFFSLCFFPREPRRLFTEGARVMPRLQNRSKELYAQLQRYTHLQGVDR